MDDKEPTSVPVAESINAPAVVPHIDRPPSPATIQSLELPAGEPIPDGSGAPGKQLDGSAEECSAQAIEHDEEETHPLVNVVLTESSQSPRASLIMEGTPLPPSMEQAGQNSSPMTSTDDQASTRSSAASSSNRTSTYSGGVDWDELGRSEEQEAGKETSDEVTIFQVWVLARESPAKGVHSLRRCCWPGLNRRTMLLQQTPSRVCQRSLTSALPCCDASRALRPFTS